MNRHSNRKIKYRVSRIENPLIYVPIRPYIYVPIRYLYICREISTNQTFLCKTNPILSAVGGLQMNLSAYIKTAYENIRNWTLGQNKPNSNPNKPNSNPILSAVGRLQMSVSTYCTKDYERNDIFAVPENKAKTNPNKANLCFSFLVLSNFWLTLYIVYCLLSPDRPWWLSGVLRWVFFKAGFLVLVRWFMPQISITFVFRKS